MHLPGLGVRHGAAIWGAIVVSIAYLSGAHMSPRRMAATVIFLGRVALTVGLVTLLAAIKSVDLPVRRIRRAMAQVEGGDTDVAIRVDDGSEIGLLQAGFNRMVAGLRERDQVRDLFGRHVGEEVARSALGRGHELGGELRDVSVLFVDVVGSTSFAASRDPHEVVETLNRFFSIVVEVVTLHGGWVNKFEGDAALCAFGAPTEHPDAPTAALAAARELRRRLHLRTRRPRRRARRVGGQRRGRQHRRAPALRVHGRRRSGERSSTADRARQNATVTAARFRGDPAPREREGDRALEARRSSAASRPTAANPSRRPRITSSAAGLQKPLLLARLQLTPPSVGLATTCTQALGPAIVLLGAHCKEFAELTLRYGSQRQRAADRSICH